MRLQFYFSLLRLCQSIQWSKAWSSIKFMTFIFIYWSFDKVEFPCYIQYKSRQTAPVYQMTTRSLTKRDCLDISFTVRRASCTKTLFASAMIYFVLSKTWERSTYLKKRCFDVKPRLFNRTWTPSDINDQMISFETQNIICKPAIWVCCLSLLNFCTTAAISQKATS